MVAGMKGGGGSLFLRSDGGPLDLVRHGPAAARFSCRFNICCLIFLEEAALVGSRGGACTWLQWSSTCAHSVAGWSTTATRAIYFLQDKGAVMEIDSVELPFCSGMQLKQSNLELSMVLQGFLHTRDGISPLVPRCSTRFKAAVQGMCWTVGDDHVLNIMLDAAMWVMLYASNQTSGIIFSSKKIISNCYMWTLEEHVFRKSLCCTMLSLPDGDYAEEAVLVLFGFFHQMWTTTLLLLIPRFNSGDILRLSSVVVHIYLQLNSSQPQVHTPDRPSGEPPAGHQLVWSTEALGDCRCGIFESGLSTDDRSLFGSTGNLRFLHVLYRCTPSYSYFVQLGTTVYCSVLESHVMLYCELQY